jgi:protein-tyrosine kinase
MNRIEEGLRKAQALRAGTSPPSGPTRIARVVDRDPAVAHRYGGRPVEFDMAALRASGLLAPTVDAQRLSQQYRTIKRPLLSVADPHRDVPVEAGNLVALTSALPGEGKTFTCVNLCLSLAMEKDWSVVIVDADCTKPHLTQLFSAEREPGLLDLLKDPNRTFDSTVMPTDIQGVALLPVGGRDEHSSELLASRRMRELCRELAADDAHRIILFDSSPLLLTSEAPVLASHVGQVVLVVRANKTPRAAVLGALEKLDPSKAIACVLNQHVSMFDGVDGHHYGYGYGGYGSYPARDQQLDAPVEPGPSDAATELTPVSRKR